MRSVISIGVGLIIAPHMNMFLLPTGFENFDRGAYIFDAFSIIAYMYTGHVTYLRFIYMEALCNNHIANVFVDLVYNSIKEHHATSDIGMLYDL